MSNTGLLSSVNYIHVQYYNPPFLYVVDYSNNGDYIGFRVGTPDKLLYDSWDDNSNESVINLRN